MSTATETPAYLLAMGENDAVLEAMIERGEHVGPREPLRAPFLREPLRAPFPWFGGKSRVAPLVWDRFGADVANYVEPFAGSLAVLLGRPGTPRVETVNDLDCYIANFWRALKAHPAGVEKWADSPVNEADLHARHLWLVNRAEWRERIKTEPDYFDVKIAGWWVWGISQWIGSGWCTNPEWRGRTNAGREARGINAVRDRVKRKIPNVGRGGMRGVVQPSLSDDKPARGRAVRVSRQLPQLSVNHSTAGRGVVGQQSRGGGLGVWLDALAARLEHVRVCCGDWARVVTPAVTSCIGVTAVFLDPPYAVADRDGVYAEDSRDVAHQVREWALANGDNPDLRICLAGYDGEHSMPATWRAVAWKANGGYANQAGETRGRANALRETLWFSPACLEPQPGLF